MTPLARPRAGRGDAADRADRGSMSLEMVLVTPVFIAFLLLLAGAGRMVDAQSQVDGAARDAVRAASVARSAGGADQMARDAAAANLKGHSWCSGGPRTDTDLVDWRPGGRVAVTIICDVDLADLAFIGLPGVKSLAGKAVAPIDTYTYRGTDPEQDDPGGAG
ncbi:TadE family protein [Actinomadura xylanilytica]|uniref:TadE family protein n=1 Tax=Actinomadura xylanilytica TaxID=887459 RepID=UPI00255A75CC|nr:TadE/TadG family type IV pilus assembly protein [Actinomadura xylanilytica]MDL4776116.1 TadE/TadG family type IV pilus assembly protein [Actinomadura xylanilytica]